MDASTKTIQELFFSQTQFVVPFFQRSYQWKKKNWDQFLGDVFAISKAKEARTHFLGPLVCVPIQSMPGEVVQFQLIDGQQRLTTVSLMLAAIRDLMLENGETDFAEEVEEDYLVHKRHSGSARYKIVPRIGDREAFNAIVDQDSALLKSHVERNIVKAFRYLKKKVKAVVKKKDVSLVDLFQGVRKSLSLVVIAIDEEDPYEIFESLNSTGLPLEQSDLIRNFVFMQVPLKEQAAFDRKVWQKFEDRFARSPEYQQVDITAFYRNFLMRNGTYCRPKEIYAGFKLAWKTTDEDVEELNFFADIELRLRRPESEEDEEVREQLRTLAELEVNTAGPLLFELFRRYRLNEIEKAEFLGCLSDISSFVLRRSVCSESSKQYGKWFPDVIKGLQADTRGSMRGQLLRRGWPGDERFNEAITHFPIYKKDRSKTKFLLAVLEQESKHKEVVDQDSLTIEHIMPQSISRDDSHGQSWRSSLGPEWFQSHQAWLHTLGNLTLTGYNAELTNHGFAAKQELFRSSNLELNRELMGFEKWGIDEIESRGRDLANRITKKWPVPLDASQPPEEEAGPSKPYFDTAALRTATVEKMERVLNVPFEEATSEARYRCASKGIALICIASRPYGDGPTAGYWFGYTPEQGEFLTEEKAGLVALGCGSPDRTFVFTREERAPMVKMMNVTRDETTGEILRWHVQIDWRDTRFELDLPSNNRKQDVTEFLIENRGDLTRFP